ncbi:hypothetical protein Glove_681g11 [Diversispora epigaea]|uniref:2OGFeDO JBP1/TET oxygenase domain-containing protein n=1 Tax=Diversispora epigaea TaxID=1348612 RepID=A0A397G649_9GLOM|nr:hypothetical protein Glove_681g11 [Diversispora epigaea]
MNASIVTQNSTAITQTSTTQTSTTATTKTYKRNLRKKIAKKANPSKNINLTRIEEMTQGESEFYDPEKHKIQGETRELTKEETRKYILDQWISEDFLSGDLVSSNHQQSTVFINPRLTFQEKFLEKRRQRLVVRELLNRGVLPPNSIIPGTLTLNFSALSSHHLNIISDAIQKKLYEVDENDDNKSLTPRSTQLIPTSFEFPGKFMDLLELEVFNCTKSTNSSVSKSSLMKSLWKEFALWACFKLAPNYVHKLHHHCCLLWSQTKCVYQHIEAPNQPHEGENIHETFLRNPKDKLYIADETTEEVASGINLEGYYHIFDPQCFKNSFKETIVDYFDLENKTAIEDVRIAVDYYYQHTRTSTSHQSKKFSKNLIEHFGGFTDSNNLPYTTSNTASSHCQEHQKCVQGLIQELQPLSGAVNKYLETSYPALYSKMEKLDLGPNVPKFFGGFPTVSINFNIICQFHRDLKDHRNTLCVVCPLGNFIGGELAFPELKLVIHVKQGQAVAFRSNLLVHGNLPVIIGNRHSVVFYIHKTVIKQTRKFGSLFSDYKLNWSRKKSSQKYSPPKLRSRNSGLKNHRRKRIVTEKEEIIEVIEDDDEAVTKDDYDDNDMETKDNDDNER